MALADTTGIADRPGPLAVAAAAAVVCAAPAPFGHLSLYRTTSARAARWPWPAAPRSRPASPAALARTAAWDHVVATKDHHVDPGAHFGDPPDFVDSWPAHCVAGTAGRRVPPGAGHRPDRGGLHQGRARGGVLGLRGPRRRHRAGRLAADARCDRGGRGRHRHRPLCAGDRAGRGARGFATTVLLDLTAGVAPRPRPRPRWTRLRAAGVTLIGSPRR